MNMMSYYLCCSLLGQYAEHINALRLETMKLSINDGKEPCFIESCCINTRCHSGANLVKLH